jgi:hypothetical protein
MVCLVFSSLPPWMYGQGVEQQEYQWDTDDYTNPLKYVQNVQNAL